MKVQLTIPSATRRFDLQKGCFYTCVPSAIERRQRELGSKRGRGFESLDRYAALPTTDNHVVFLFRRHVSKRCGDGRKRSGPKSLCGS